MPRMAAACSAFSADDDAFLMALQRKALQYFLDNQLATTGLVLDRQRNFGPLRSDGLSSTAATGMGFIAVALASAAPYRLLPRTDAVTRLRRGLETALLSLPHTRGVMPHFLDTATGAVIGSDVRSTIDTAWLVAGGLWAAAFLGDKTLDTLAGQLFGRVDWRAWTAPGGLLRHGMDASGQYLPCCWDRLNGETVFMYVLAAGAASNQAWPSWAWHRLGTFLGEAGGERFGSADLGLFVFQYGLDLLDSASLRWPDGRNLVAEAATATVANARVCRAARDRFKTYRRFWGLSAGDGPGDPPDEDTYRCYAPATPLDGTAHVSATLASLAHRPALVWENLFQARAERCLQPLGRYGFSNLNLDRHWVGRDMVGIDAGAIVLALDNWLCANRVRRTFHSLEEVQRGLERIGCTRPRHRLAA
jgi:hypothetical protein